MKLVTFEVHGQKRHGALCEEGKVVDFLAAFAAILGLTEHEATRRFGADMVGFIERSDESLAMAQRALSEVGLCRHQDVRLLSPILRPTSMRDGYAFRQHVETARRNRGLEMIPEFDEFPVFYFTNHLAVTGPGPVAVMPRHLEKLDFELEAAVVVGKPGRNWSLAEADDAIFGLTIMNDWSARVLQMDEMKLSLGPAKGKDFATSLGPCLVTKDELVGVSTKTDRGTIFNLQMLAHVNGIEVSRGNLADMTWTFAQLLERVSYGVNMSVGEVIGSGTVGTGCFLEINGTKKTNTWLGLGDSVVLSVDHLGELHNVIVSAT